MKMMEKMTLIKVLLGCKLLALGLISFAIWIALSQGRSLIMHPTYLLGMLLLVASHWFTCRQNLST